MKQRNINFRQSRSERSGESSYSNFRKSFVKKFKMDKFIPSWKEKNGTN